MTIRKENEVLRAAIKKHRAQRADDRCWLDDLELYRVLGDGIQDYDPSMPPREDFLANCARYYDRRCVRGNWPTYQQLQEALTEAREYIARHLKAEEDAMEVCAKLEAMRGLPESDEVYQQKVDEISGLMRERQAKTHSLLESIDGLLCLK
jgi:hypothetical protein